MRAEAMASASGNEVLTMPEGRLAQPVREVAVIDTDVRMLSASLETSLGGEMTIDLEGRRRPESIATTADAIEAPTTASVEGEPGRDRPTAGDIIGREAEVLVA
jgi:hypothetical protein